MSQPDHNPFEVVVESTGDHAETETLDAALYAAAKLQTEARSRGVGRPTAHVYEIDETGEAHHLSLIHI